ncbi:MAG: ATP-binding protein [Flavobacteriales bacterium]|nr:ATP-binding protein [Flavobacteriales bacterium]MBX2958526.1 ATP-binding protein [Flavobacteriales bacterium]
MITREIESLIKEYSKQFRSLLVVGPRQTGKSTLVKKVFPNKPYVSLENPDERLLAENDPRAFLYRFPKGAILDEVQRTPLLFNYLQEIIDNSDEDGLFILTGSNNLLLQSNISQSLAGRVGVIDLLPLTFQEIEKFGKTDYSLNELIFKGSYPEIYDKNRNPTLWYPAYIRTYVERDVRLIKNIENTLLFTKFLKICAGRVGQQVNVSAISNECGIDVKTVNSWISVLENTYVIKLLQPYYKSFNKRLVKTPKLYFYDTGLVCSLLNIKNTDELSFSHFRGSLVENYLLVELVKKIKNKGASESIYYWRDNNGVEVDILIDYGNKLLPIEIKSAQTFNNDFLSNIKKFNSYSYNNNGWVIYDGKLEFETENGIVVKNWKNATI